MQSIELNDLFVSIQGEGLTSGLLTTFVRFAKCNLSCSWCDTDFSEVRFRFSPQQLVKTINKYKIKEVCITGGEPLIDPDIKTLLAGLKDYNVSMETNGSINLEPFLFYDNVTIVMDIKCPSSKMHSKMEFRNLWDLRERDQVKFVISDKEDYNYAKKVVEAYGTKAQYLMSPIFTKNGFILKDLAEWLIKDKLKDIRLQVQLHKLAKVK